MFRRLITSICLSSLLFFLPLEGAESLVVKKEHIPSIGVDMLHLNNGMRVVLKHTNNQEEVSVRLTAAGGFSSLDNGERTAACFAPQVAVRSGVGEYSFDQLHALLYDHGMDFSSEVGAFSRHVAGSAYSEEVEVLFQLIYRHLTESRFEEGALSKVLLKAEEKAKHQNRATFRVYENAYLQFNTGDFFAFQPFSHTELKRTSLAGVKRNFHRFFSDPSDFVCVIVGDFNKKSVESYIEKYLASIPRGESSFGSVSHQPSYPAPIQGVKTKIVTDLKGYSEAITRITLPLAVSVNQESYSLVEQAALILQKRLKKALRDEFDREDVYVNVSVEYPFFPSLKQAWFKIQYISEPKQSVPMGQVVLATLGGLNREVVSDMEMKEARRKFMKVQRLREKENLYWVNLLSNASLKGWNFNQLDAVIRPKNEAREMQNFFQENISLKDYTVVSSIPR